MKGIPLDAPESKDSVQSKNRVPINLSSPQLIVDI